MASRRQQPEPLVPQNRVPAKASVFLNTEYTPFGCWTLISVELTVRSRIRGPWVV